MSMAIAAFSLASLIAAGKKWTSSKAPSGPCGSFPRGQKWLVGQIEKERTWEQVLPEETRGEIEEIGMGLECEAPYLMKGGRKIRASKALRKHPQLKGVVEQFLSSSQELFGKLSVWVSTQADDILVAARVGRSCLSPGGGNEYTVESHLDLSAVVFVEKGGQMLSRAWILPGEDGRCLLERKWYGPCHHPCLEVVGMVEDWLGERWLLAEGEKFEIHPEFEGWTDLTGGIENPGGSEWETVDFLIRPECGGWRSWTPIPIRKMRRGDDRLLVEEWELDGWV